MTDHTSKDHKWRKNKRKNHRKVLGSWTTHPHPKSTHWKILESQIRTWESVTTKQNIRINKEETDPHNVNVATNIKEPPTRNQAHEGKGPWEMVAGRGAP
jgi:hypothetical protein